MRTKVNFEDDETPSDWLVGAINQQERGTRVDVEGLAEHVIRPVSVLRDSEEDLTEAVRVRLARMSSLGASNRYAGWFSFMDCLPTPSGLARYTAVACRYSVTSHY
jgi:hypothetical protein